TLTLLFNDQPFEKLHFRITPLLFLASKLQRSRTHSLGVKSCQQSDVRDLQKQLDPFLKQCQPRIHPYPARPGLAASVHHSFTISAGSPLPPLWGISCVNFALLVVVAVAKAFLWAGLNRPRPCPRPPCEVCGGVVLKVEAQINASKARANVTNNKKMNIIG